MYNYNREALPGESTRVGLRLNEELNLEFLQQITFLTKKY